MGRFDKPLDNPINWSFKVGRLFNIDIRVHVIFVLAALILLSRDVAAAREGGGDWSLGSVLVGSLGIYAILFFVVLVHEFGHCYGARSTGGEAEEILLWPLGGLAMVSPPHTARAHMITAVAGPMVNVIFCVVAGVVLIVWTGSLGSLPINPLSPMWPVNASVVSTTAQLWVVRFFGISYLLLLFNLLPVFPFDGGRVLQCVLWSGKGYHRATEIATSAGMIGAICLGVFGLFTGQSWVLLMIAVFGYFESWRMKKMLRTGEMLDTGEFGYDFSGGYTSLDRQVDHDQPKPGFLEQRRARRAAAKAERERKREEEHSKQVERILAKVSAQGMDSLTPQERKVLEEETARRRA